MADDEVEVQQTQKPASKEDKQMGGALNQEEKEVDSSKFAGVSAILTRFFTVKHSSRVLDILNEYI